MHRTHVKVLEDVLDANGTIARANRADFDREHVTVVNLMGSPGAGKTTVLEQVVSSLPGVRVGVLEGDVKGTFDADRIAAKHVPVTQINTDPSFGGECHLDANMVRSAVPSLPLAEIDLLVIENVGNLVCPAEFHVGEHTRVMVTSVTEGEDKPLKYPLMFRACDLVLVNKIDLLPHLDVDMEKFLYHLDAVHPGVQHIELSARTGQGVGEWRDWLVHAASHQHAVIWRTGASVSPHALEELLDRRTVANERFFAAEASRIAELCRVLGDRFLAGGRLLACGASAQDQSDARHVAVEFVHPVIVGKRALPAICLAPGELDLIAEPSDAVIAFGAEPAIATVRARGCLTIGFERGAAEWVFESPSDDPFVVQELVETTYHVLWELVHVFLEHASRAGRGGGASSFLYPFLSGAESDEGSLVDDVAASVLMKAREIGELRTATVTANRLVLERAGAEIRARLDAGGTLFAFGNGGSATDAMDLVADLRAAPQGWPGRRCLDLTDDPAILTALANDIGPAALYARQLIAFGRPGDIAVALSTSGGSVNIVEALAEARRRGLATIALVGYDGGRIAAEQLADHVIAVASEHIPRIQEAQATAYHLLRELVR